MLFSGHVWSLLGVSRKKKRDDVREYQPDIHSLTHCNHAACRGRGTALTCLCLRQDKACVRKKQTVHEITPISHGETEADARKRKARNPTREEPEARLPIGEPRLAQREQRKSPCPRRTESAKPPESEVTRFPVVCTQEKDLRFESGMVGICMEAWKEGRKDARGASTDLDHGKKATRTKRSGPPLHPVSAL